jgi:hypothetical protein
MPSEASLYSSLPLWVYREEIQKFMAVYMKFPFLIMTLDIEMEFAISFPLTYD